MRKKCFLLFIIAIAVWIFTGCNTEDNNVQMKKYENDGYLGLTKSLPNMPTNPSYHNYRKDTELVKQSLKGIDGVIDSTITIANGTNMIITIQVSNHLSKQEAKQIEKTAYKEIKKQLPRYEVSVRSNKSG
ncbi:hypothetical protein [Chengkuizengella marina]|uniref:Sporulation lipoprotein YhcN/YlaJ (Spore_YhcN_YlaJ) n=1 Tax=Chengkuizengella marina TaxID=2507566 RepID=A0A6N9Q874_9BACL|nr:hypothetical protein [Chengkuizengella marina]NBI31076.1 hypothetical protein [Chengkuizengella marina]